MQEKFNGRGPRRNAFGVDVFTSKKEANPTPSKSDEEALDAVMQNFSAHSQDVAAENTRAEREKILRDDQVAIEAELAQLDVRKKEIQATIAESAVDTEASIASEVASVAESIPTLVEVVDDEETQSAKTENATQGEVVMPHPVDALRPTGRMEEIAKQHAESLQALQEEESASPIELAPGVETEAPVDMNDVPGYEAFRAERVRAREEKQRTESAYNTAYTEYFAELKTKRDAGGYTGYWKNKISDAFGIKPEIPAHILALQDTSNRANTEYIDATRAYHAERRRHAMGVIKDKNSSLPALPYDEVYKRLHALDDELHTTTDKERQDAIKKESRTLEKSLVSVEDRLDKKDALFEATVAGRSVIDVIKGRKDVQAQAFDALTDDPKMRERVQKLLGWVKDNPKTAGAIGVSALALTAATALPALAAMGVGVALRQGVIKSGDLLFLNRMKAVQEQKLQSAKTSMFNRSLSEIEAEYDKNQKSIDFARKATKVAATGVGILAGRAAFGSELAQGVGQAIQESSREAVQNVGESIVQAIHDASPANPEFLQDVGQKLRVLHQEYINPEGFSIPNEVIVNDWQSSTPEGRAQIEEFMMKSPAEMQSMADKLPVAPGTTFSEATYAPSGIEVAPAPTDHVIEKGNNLWRITTGEQVPGRSLPDSFMKLPEDVRNLKLSQFMAHLDAHDEILQKIGITSGNPSVISVGDHINLAELDKAFNDFTQSEVAKSPLAQSQINALNYPNGMPQPVVTPVEVITTTPVVEASAPINLPPLGTENIPGNVVTDDFGQPVGAGTGGYAVSEAPSSSPAENISVQEAPLQGFKSMSPEAQKLITQIDPPTRPLFSFFRPPLEPPFNIMKDIPVGAILDTAKTGGYYEGMSSKNFDRFVNFITQQGPLTPEQTNMTLGQLIESRATTG